MPSGGVRPGAGRPRQDLSDRQLKKLVKAFEKKAKETGKTVHDLLADLAYNNNAVEVVSYTKDDRAIKKIVLEVPIKDRIRCVELFVSLTITKFSQKEVTENHIGPTIRGEIVLPPVNPRPPEYMSGSFKVDPGRVN